MTFSAGLTVFSTSTAKTVLAGAATTTASAGALTSAVSLRSLRLLRGRRSRGSRGSRTSPSLTRASGAGCSVRWASLSLRSVRSWRGRRSWRGFCSTVSAAPSAFIGRSVFCSAFGSVFSVRSLRRRRSPRCARSSVRLRLLCALRLLAARAAGFCTVTSTTSSTTGAGGAPKKKAFKRAQKPTFFGSTAALV